MTIIKFWDDDIVSDQGKVNGLISSKKNIY